MVLAKVICNAETAPKVVLLLLLVILVVCGLLTLVSYSRCCMHCCICSSLALHVLYFLANDVLCDSRSLIVHG